MDHDLVKCVVCKGSYKKRGLKIHQKKSGCYKKLTDPHRRDHKTVVPNIQEINHSDVGRQADQEEQAAGRKIGEEERREDREHKGEEPRQTKEDEEIQESDRGNAEELEIHVDDSVYTEVDSWLNKTMKEAKGNISEKKKGQDIRGWFKTDSRTNNTTPGKPEDASSKTKATAPTKGKQEMKERTKEEAKKRKPKQKEDKRSTSLRCGKAETN